MDRKISATDVAIFMRENYRELSFAKVWQHFAGQQDGGTKYSESFGIFNSCGLKESNSVLGPDDLAGHPKLGGRKYRCVSPQPMNSVNSSAEAGQPKQNKHPPNADDPTLDSGRDCELPLLLRMSLPAPKEVIRRSSLRGNLQLRCLCH